MTHFTSVSPALRWLLVAIVVLATSACASSLLVRTFYNDLGNKAAERFGEYAKFNSQQIDWINRQAVAFHRWHRNTQLPLYADRLNTLASRLEENRGISKAEITQWIETAETLAQNIQRCHPINNATNFLFDLSNSQVEQIGNHLSSQRNKWAKRRTEESTQQRLERRVENITKWADRLGAGFNDQQRTLLTNTLRKQKSLGTERLAMRKQWITEFTENLRQRRKPEFSSKLAKLLERQWQQTETEYPQQWAHNEALWTDFTEQFLALQTPKQRSAMVKQLRKFTNILGTMSSATASSSDRTECGASN